MTRSTINKWIACFSVLLLFLLLITLPSHALSNTNGKLIVHFLDVGVGDSIFIRLPDGDNILVDTGNSSAGSKVANFLKAAGINRINHLITTHAHDDHMGGIFSLLSEFEVTVFYDNGFNNFHNPMYGKYIALVRSDLSKYKILQAGESLKFGDIIIDILNPLLPPTGNLNQDSIVLKLTYGEIKILLAGDMGQPGEKRLLNSNIELKSHILKVGHHGDSDASSMDFLKKVSPDLAIISVATEKKYARPHDKTIARLLKSGAKIYRTDINGTIVLITNGKTYSIESERN